MIRNNDKKLAMIAMSGGVDSSVCALLVKNLGYECVGATMKLFDNEDIGECSEKACCSLKDSADAARVAHGLGMNHYVWDFTEDFRRDVIETFASSYEQGITPNPCIDCNRYLKYQRFYERSRQMDFDYIATGHYARIEFDETYGRYVLKKAVDDTKDQSYVLYMIGQEQLAHTLFPLGDLTKVQAREIANAHNFVNANKHESQDICFVPDGDYATFIKQYRGHDYAPGNFVNENGKILGKHKGIIHYTIGQRKGLGIAFGEPTYVKSIDQESNTIVLSKDKAVYTDSLVIGNLSINIPELLDSDDLTVKIRYSHGGAHAKVTRLESDGRLADARLHVQFDEPQRAITRGQSAVIYHGDMVVGGGIIIG
ncbi:MAG: tRNA 2-thiouridine(34) synthase MnmA [Clostridiales Family XIII bacterium]|nr:tRNA 2-thiouridine(34) synthase MnmA [Clostridiales Family XIII bacterium]